MPISEGGVNMAYLTIKDVHSFYGPSHILHGASLEVERGKIATLLGRNGMGKTTLLRTIMGLTPAKTGEIVFDGKRIEHLKPYDIYDGGVGYVPQGRHMFPFLTVQENLRMGLRNKRQRNPAIFEKLFEYFPILKERLKQKAGTLSGGEQQQLAIARALAGEVKIMLLDEPTEGIQPSIVDEILELLVEINRTDELTILLVEQNMELALSVAESYFVMEKGVIVDGGSVAQMDKEDVIRNYLVV
jgi:urea transport system ATP-binding protein